jgi:hypothetical protein
MKSPPDFYRNRVRGQLDQKWAEWFDGFEIMTIGEDTLLCGHVPDQAALHGVLAKIRDLGLVLRRLEQIEASDEGQVP